VEAVAESVVVVEAFVAAVLVFLVLASLQGVMVAPKTKNMLIKNAKIN
jgi:hypothetical protein